MVSGYPPPGILDSIVPLKVSWVKIFSFALREFVLVALV
jgi:hypothetical protein